MFRILIQQTVCILLIILSMFFSSFLVLGEDLQQKHSEQPVSSRTPIVLNTVTGQPAKNTSIIQAAFKKLDIPLEIIEHSPERALLNANSGIDDGTFVRVEGMEKKYKNLVRVPESISEFQFYAVTKMDIQIKGWESLAPYSVGIILGAKIVEEKVGDVAFLTKVHRPVQLFDLLEQNRADIIIVDYEVGKKIIHDKKLQGIKFLAPPLEIQPMYLYLHKTQKHLINTIAHAIHELKQEKNITQEHEY
ncbi:MAG: transporter substrate-binding domain-containing protein [Burkholderiales bacterium]|nr:transporter substrate-binding domain-containing protein [Burkholderiales bacterium]MDR4518417.1 transporter substrate-binding domain-containing protein [Nitrosomonas sp.]